MGFYETVVGYLEQKRAGVIATVIERAGSAPRDAGAKMFVGDDGKLYGTIGGGRLEHNAYQESMSLMGSQAVKVLHIRMNAQEIVSSGMICGGDVDVFLEPVLERHKDLYRRLEHLETRGKRGVVVTRSAQGSILKTLIEDDTRTTGDPIPEPELTTYLEHIHESTPWADNGVIVEPLQALSILYIFGAGHVSQYITRIAAMVGFFVVVIDDREEFANKQRFPEADEIVVEDFQRVFEKLKFTGKEFVVIVTRGHQYDAGVLENTLKRQTRYVGMIGSKRKVKMVLDHMRAAGISDENVGKVHAPIGLAIHAETPEEIAVSIVGELIQVRRG